MKPCLLLALLFTGCASDDGTAPTIASLSYTPMTVPAGQQSTVSGTILFTDDDGDLDQIGIAVKLPDATKQELPMTDLQGVGDMTTGTIAFSMFITPPLAGAYVFDIFVTDSGDHESNKLQGTLTAN